MVKVSKFYDKKAVLKDIYLSFFYGAKIGVLGLNGSGKSSLLRIIAGTDKEFNGEVVFSKGYSVGYLEQEPKLDESKTVQQIVEEAVQSTVDLLKEFEEIRRFSFTDGGPAAGEAEAAANQTIVPDGDPVEPKPPDPDPDQPIPADPDPDEPAAAEAAERKS